MKRLTCLLFLAGSLVLGTVAVADDLFCEGVPYMPNDFYTTKYGPAAVDVIRSPINMLTCTSGQYALCYYSGAAPLPCKVGEAGHAACQCQVFTADDENPMYVDINSILNLCIYVEAVKQCGKDGGKCRNLCDDLGSGKCPDAAKSGDDPPMANVCDYIAQGLFSPKADYISTFSENKVKAPGSNDTFKINLHPDTVSGTYAGCMTASCTGTDQNENGATYTTCHCPTWPPDGEAEYQFGRQCGDGPTGNCKLGPNQVWSAAYSPGQ